MTEFQRLGSRSPFQREAGWKKHIYWYPNAISTVAIAFPARSGLKATTISPSPAQSSGVAIAFPARGGLKDFTNNEFADFREKSRSPFQREAGWEKLYSHWACHTLNVAITFPARGGLKDLLRLVAIQMYRVVAIAFPARGGLKESLYLFMTSPQIYDIPSNPTVIYLPSDKFKITSRSSALKVAIIKTPSTSQSSIWGCCKWQYSCQMTH